MISRQEFLKLYCNEELYRKTGKLSVDPDKLATRLTIDPFKTLQDISEFEETYDANSTMPDFASTSTSHKNLDDFDLVNALLSDEMSWGSEDSIK